MNKQLERDLQCTIQSLKGAQLANVLTYYEKISESACEKVIISTSWIILRKRNEFWMLN